MTRRIDAQKAVLASEKLVFAAGRVGPGLRHRGDAAPAPSPPVAEPEVARSLNLAAAEPEPERIPAYMPDRKSVVLGNGCSGRVESGGRRIIKKKKHKKT